MADCCGASVVTPHCPRCGKKIHSLYTLLQYLEEKVAALSSKQTKRSVTLERYSAWLNDLRVVLGEQNEEEG